VAGGGAELADPVAERAPFPPLGTTPPGVGPDPAGDAAPACAAAPSSSSPIVSPTATVSPLLRSTLRRTPAAGAGSATVAFSLSTSTSGSSAWTGSPSRFSHAPTVACVTDSPSDGT
jgi:hypothetical protein